MGRSVWLREEGVGVSIGENYESRNSRSDIGGDRRQGNWQQFNPILGVNLAGLSKRNELPKDGDSSGLIFDTMENDLEENPIQVGEGKKRPRADYPILNLSFSWRQKFQLVGWERCG